MLALDIGVKHRGFIGDAAWTYAIKERDPIGEALIMTAAGLAVAIPAVLGYNVLGRQINQIEAQLEGFAHDLRALLAEPQA